MKMSGMIATGTKVRVPHLNNQIMTVVEVNGEGLFLRHLSSPGITQTIKKNVEELEGSTMYDVVLIDWSTIAYPAWEKMKRKEYISETGSEIVEFTRNIAEEAYYLVTRFKGLTTQVYFILDSKPWRNGYYQHYYEKFLKAYRIRSKETKETGYYITYDTYHYVIWDSVLPSKPKLKDVKLSNKAWKELQPSLQNKRINPFEIPDLRPYLPRYKGNRENTWKYDTPKEQFKKYRNMAAYNLGKTLNTHVIEVADCEADDIISAACHFFKPEDRKLIISSDSDLDQLQGLLENVTRWTPEPEKREFIKKTQEEAIIDMWIKTLSGDTSDHIKPVTIGNSTCGPKKAAGLVGDCLAGNIVDHPSMIRNMKLVQLERAPGRIVRSAMWAVAESKLPTGKRHKLSQYGVQKSKAMAILKQAKNEQLND